MADTRTSRHTETPYAAGSVAIYARSDGPDSGRKIDLQVSACRELAAVRQLAVSHELVDKDNPERHRPRPGYAELLDLLTTGRVGGVIAYNVDKFTRRPQELEALLAAADASGATVHTVENGAFDLGTDQGRLMMRILTAVAPPMNRPRSVRQGRPQSPARPAPRRVAYVCISDDRDLGPSDAVAQQEQAARAALARLGNTR